MKLLFLTGSRGEWGYIRPILNLCKKKGIEYNICATNMHLLPSFGMTINEIIKDGFKVEDTIHMALDGYNHYTMVKSMAVMQMSFVDILNRIKPDWLILAGDRGETLMGAITAAYTYTPIAHIQAGELSGNIDGQARHAIGKFSHIHFASNDDAASRLYKLGEEKKRIFNVGAPQLDEIVGGKYSSLKQLKNNIGLNTSKPYLVVVQHPVTEDFTNAKEQIKNTIHAVNKFNIDKVWIMPNNDAGSQFITEEILNSRKSSDKIFYNLSREDYLGVINNSMCLVGNSSSGLLEAPTLNVPAINIGRRQDGRVRGDNVIDIKNFSVKDIENAITVAISDEFRKKIINSSNPYGDGHSSERILDVLLNTKINDSLIVKRLTY
jgi:GDP/UDP-N,N'-diacetylbacillosamine 2-epimerase (hydrolysing)